MKIEVWLPILTLGLGWAGAQVTEVLRDRRAGERERQARQAELQRTTLLELQDALLEESNLASEVRFEAFSVYDPGDPKQMALEERQRQAENRFRDARAKVRLLASRVQNDQARSAVTTFEFAVRQAVLSDRSDHERQNEVMSQVGRTYEEAIDLLGELLRERY